MYISQTSISILVPPRVADRNMLNHSSHGFSGKTNQGSCQVKHFRTPGKQRNSNFSLKKADSAQMRKF